MLTLDTGYRPHTFQRHIHRAMARHRFGVMVCHRRFGKTVFAVNALIDAALRFPGRDGRFGYVAPYLKQATQISWDYLKEYTAPLGERVKANETGKYVVFASGARIRLYGADNPDSLRGLYFDGVVVDEVADVKPNVWGEILRPALADRKGWALFIGTPKGANLFSELYEFAKTAPGWYAGLYRANETLLPWLPEGELALARAQMTDAQYRQEFLCDFSASSEDVLIPYDLALFASQTVADERAVRGQPKVVGVDVARFGSDRTVIMVRQGARAFMPEVLENQDNMAVAARVAAVFDREAPDSLCIDVGGGQGVIDRLRELGYPVIEVNFGARAMRPVYANKRAEMWDSLRGWLAQGGQIPDLPELKSDLSSPTYFYDAFNRLTLERKEKLKERGLRSPDLGDALALTFAWAPVGPATASLEPPRKLETDFDPYSENEVHE